MKNAILRTISTLLILFFSINSLLITTYTRIYAWLLYITYNKAIPIIKIKLTINKILYMFINNTIIFKYLLIRLYLTYTILTRYLYNNIKNINNLLIKKSTDLSVPYIKFLGIKLYYYKEYLIFPIFLILIVISIPLILLILIKISAILYFIITGILAIWVNALSSLLNFDFSRLLLFTPESYSSPIENGAFFMVQELQVWSDRVFLVLNFFDCQIILYRLFSNLSYWAYSLSIGSSSGFLFATPNFFELTSAASELNVNFLYNLSSYFLSPYLWSDFVSTILLIFDRFLVNVNFLEFFFEICQLACNSFASRLCAWYYYLFFMLPWVGEILELFWVTFVIDSKGALQLIISYLNSSAMCLEIFFSSVFYLLFVNFFWFTDLYACQTTLLLYSFFGSIFFNFPFELGFTFLSSNFILILRTAVNAIFFLQNLCLTFWLIFISNFFVMGRWFASFFYLNTFFMFMFFELFGACLELFTILIDFRVSLVLEYLFGVVKLFFLADFWIFFGENGFWLRCYFFFFVLSTFYTFFRSWRSKLMYRQSHGFSSSVYYFFLDNFFGLTGFRSPLLLSANNRCFRRKGGAPKFLHTLNFFFKFTASQQNNPSRVSLYLKSPSLTDDAKNRFYSARFFLKTKNFA